MIRVAIVAAAFEAITRTLPFGSVGYEKKINERGERLIWLEDVMADRLGAMRGHGESYSDVILRIADGATALMRMAEPPSADRDLESTPEQDCIAFRSKDASMMPTRMPSSTGLSGGRQVGIRSSLGVSALLRRERRLL